MPKENTQTETVERPPVVVVVGHIDHGKSTLLDYIREENTVAGEAGGITQHLSAYEVEHPKEDGTQKKITFLDTPGHEAFAKMRARGCRSADVAILVVSAEDGVKPQTLEAVATITESNIPYIVAINKIDKPQANVEKIKSDLAEHEIYLEGYGGDISYVPISAKEGTGIDELLDLILLVSELEDFKARVDVPATGVVIESNTDPKRGISATLLIRDGHLSQGMTVVAETALAKVRIMEDFTGATVSEATVSSPVRIVGFNALPPTGARFVAFTDKKEAEAYAAERAAAAEKIAPQQVTTEAYLPIILKTDVTGSQEAIMHEIEKISIEDITPVIIDVGVGDIGESDAKRSLADERTVIIGFNVSVDGSAKEAVENAAVEIKTFDVIYNLTEWLSEELERRRPRKAVDEVVGAAKVLKTFSQTKDKQVVGGKVTSGMLSVGNSIRILRRDSLIGDGSIVGLQEQKVGTKQVQEGRECGIEVMAQVSIAAGDVIEAIETTVR